MVDVRIITMSLVYHGFTFLIFLCGFLLAGLSTVCAYLLIANRRLVTNFRSAELAKSEVNKTMQGVSFQEILRSLRNQEFMVNFSNYLNIIDGNLDRRLDTSLSILGKYLNIGRISIYEDFENGLMARNTHEWCRAGVESEMLQNQQVVYKNHLRNLKTNLNKDGVIYAAESDQFPKGLNEIIENRKSESVLVLPLYVYNDYFGFIGFNACDSNRSWDDMEIGFLKNISMVLSTSFERRLINLEIKNNEIKFKDLFNYSSDSIFIYG
jgi:transcriptional regulator with GAF, ATPase, and Fis domain